MLHSCAACLALPLNFNIKPLPSHSWNWEMYLTSLRKVSSVPVSRAEVHFCPADLHLIQINETRSQLKGKNTVSVLSLCTCSLPILLGVGEKDNEVFVTVGSISKTF